MSSRSVTSRRFLAAALVLAGLGLGGCEQVTDLLPDSKKPLPGERKLLFPEGVPGVTQGVPPELIRNPQAQQGAQPQAPQAESQAEPETSAPAPASSRPNRSTGN
jgi:hypothetical protein